MNSTTPTSARAAALVLLVSAAACSSPETFSFPRGFLFGTATAGFQVDMGCPTFGPTVCDDTKSDWYVFVTSPVFKNDPNAHVKGDSPDLGPGHFELFQQDFDLAQRDLKNNAFRMSLEWSRLFPQATDSATDYQSMRSLASPEALAHYHAVFAALRARGLKPFVTLNHYTLPTWIHEPIACHQDLASCPKKGWLARERTVREIAKYAGFAAKEFGGEVDLWATHNEAFTSIVIAGYLLPSQTRSNPPAVSMKVAEAKAVYLALVEAHARMYDAVKANDTVDADGDGTAAEVGIVYPMAPMRPKDPTSARDVQAASNVFYLWNLLFLNAVIKGEVDANWDQSKVVRADLQNRMDFVGLNYYGSVVIKGLDGPFFPAVSPLTTFDPTDFKQNNADPRGLYEMLMLLKGMGKRVYISENGTSDPQDTGLQSEYLVRHLTWVTRAIRDGADVRGYFYWTLMDNYEWNSGFDVKVGLFGMDGTVASKPRTPRNGVDTYRRIAGAGKIPADLTTKYPEPETAK